MGRRHPLSLPLHCAALIAGLCVLPLATRSDWLPERGLPVPRALLHADGDDNGIYDDLETRLAEADPTVAVPAVVLFDVPLEQVNLAALRAHAGPFAITARFPHEAAIAARLTPRQVEVIASMPDVTHVEGDDWISCAREQAVPAFGVAKARDHFRRSGDGDSYPESYSPADHTIAVVDTGIDGRHEDFAGGKIIGWLDLVNDRPEPYDDLGHGTHVASIAAGRLRDGVGGVAPGAALVGVKVISKNGNARTTDVVKGLDWCLERREEFGIRVLNLSLSGAGSSDGTDIMSRAIKRCVAAGIVVCVAAGNHGPAAYTIPAPGAAREAITVGTMRDPARGGFALWTTSGRGPTADRRLKPDLVAAGFQILAAKAGTTTQSLELTGSSMATPFVAGVCALMLEADPALTPGQVKRILKQTAVDFGPAGEDVDYGSGRLDGYAAIRACEPPGEDDESEAPPVPAHRFFSGSLEVGGFEEWTVEVTDRKDPIAAVLVAPEWSASSPSRFQIQLRDPGGSVVTSAAQERRAQIISFQPLRTGTYTLRVDALSGSGPYFLDVSCDAAEENPQPPGDEAQGGSQP